MIECPECNNYFEIIWSGIERPTYCPFCGQEINYQELRDIKREI